LGTVKPLTCKKHKVFSTICFLQETAKALHQQNPLKIEQVKKPPPLTTSQGTWARSNVKKAHTFAGHLAKVFQMHPSESEPEEEEALIQLLKTPYQLEPPINCLERAEVQEVINSINPKKSSGYDLLTGKILKELLSLE
jgi:hypothetical protein